MSFSKSRINLNILLLLQVIYTLKEKKSNLHDTSLNAKDEREAIKVIKTSVCIVLVDIELKAKNIHATEERHLLLVSFIFL